MRRQIVLLFIGTIILTSMVSVAMSHFFQEDMIPCVEAQANVTFGKVPLEISFSCLSYDQEVGINKVLWEFGDGTTAEKKTVTHTYTNTGTYHVIISVWDEANQLATDSIIITAVHEYKPTAMITVNSTYGTPPLEVSFTGDASHLKSKISYFLWDFDDGATSKRQQTKHWFNATGIYKVSLTVIFENGDEASSSVDITVIDPYIPQAIASASRMKATAFQKVQFFGDCFDSDSSMHTYHWDFGDSILKKNLVSTEQNPTHRFYQPGIYYVTLNITDADGNSDWDTIIIEITENFLSRSLSKLEDQLIDIMFNLTMPFLSKIIDIHLGECFTILY